MHPFKVIMVTATAALSASACKDPPPPSDAPPSAAPATRDKAAHASKTAVPGSHEDWCGEHEVPESMCTRCNPTLAAAFRATGDWCQEHGLPKSQCRACNPALVIARPPQAEDR